MGKRRADIPLRERLLRKTDRSGECWIWLGGKDANGYGQLKISGKTSYTHRLSYEAFIGPIPESLVIDHLCRIHACLNPQHLEAVTSGVNSLRGESPSVLTWRTGVCQRGHELAVDGIITQWRRGKLVHACRKCIEWRAQERDIPRQREKRRAAAREREVALLSELPEQTDPDDPGQTYLTTEQAAKAAHVDEARIRDWGRRGLITPIAHGATNYYLELDVLRVEAETRREPRRRQLATEAMEGLNTQVA